MWIQVLLVVGLIAFAFIDLRNGGGGARHQALRRIGLVAFIGLGIFSILFPEWLGWVAGLVGVGRGADLVFYALVVAFLFYVATNHRRFVALDRKLTILARQLALTEAKLHDRHQDDARAGIDPLPQDTHVNPPDGKPARSAVTRASR